MKRLSVAILLTLVLVATPALAAKQLFVFYEKSSPFPGFIRFTGQVDMAQAADGSTIKEHLIGLKTQYPDADYALFPMGSKPDREAVKYDQATQTLVPLEPGDITPKAQAALDKAQKEQDMAANLPSWSQVNNAINNISNLAEAKAFLKKLARVVYWDVKNRPD